MIYLDDGSRPRMKADIAAVLRPPFGLRQLLHLLTAARPAGRLVRRARNRDLAVTASAPIGSGRQSLAQGGDPYLPPALRVAPTSLSPRGAALQALVARKIAARAADPYR